MTPEQQLELARKCAAEAYRSNDLVAIANDIKNIGVDSYLYIAVQSALLAIRHMQAEIGKAVAAERARCAAIAEFSWQRICTSDERPKHGAFSR